MASRTVSRLTENRAARSRSGGSASPGATMPSRMVCSSRATVSSNALPLRTGRNSASEMTLWYDSSALLTTGFSLQGRHVCGADPAVDQECRSRDEAGVVTGEKRDRCREFFGLGEPSLRDVHEP